MTRCKKFVLILTVIALCAAMAACGHGVPSGIVEMDPETGDGTASFTMVVPKNGAPDVGNNFVEPNGDDGPNNTSYITSPDALLTLIQNNIPEGFTVTMNEVTKMVEQEDEFGDVDTVDQGSFDYTISFPFNGIEDLNAKLKQWLPQQYWDAAAAVLTFEVKEAALSDTALTLDMHILDVIAQWAFTLTSTDTTGAVVDGGSGFDYAYYYNMAKSTLTVKLGKIETTGRYDTVELSVTAGVPEETAPPTTDEPGTEPAPTDPAPTDPAPTEPESEVPVGTIVAVILVVAAVAVVLILRKRGGK